MIVALVVAVLVIGLIAELPWWGLITSWMVIGIIAIWVLTLFDVWRRTDMSTMAAVLWTVFIFIFPILTTIVYVFTPVGRPNPISWRRADRLISPGGGLVPALTVGSHCCRARDR
jgi:hypothetical protein